MASQTSPTSMTTIESLPPEIISDIISRLPVESIAENRCVCKLWYKSIVTDRRSLMMHYAKLCQNPLPTTTSLIIFIFDNKLGLLYTPNIDNCENAIKLKQCPLAHKPWFRVSEILGSCNGLICICSQKNILIVLNPLVGDWIRLPKAHKPNISYSPYGFGYDSKNNVYKVIRTFPHPSEYMNLKVEIITLGDNCWRSIGTITNNVWTNSGVFVKGCLHWLAANSGDTFILAFNVEDENFGMVPIHDFDNSYQHSFELGTLGGNLMIVDHVDNDIQVWVMNQYGVKESWVLNFIIPQQSDRWIKRILGVQTNGNILMQCGDVYDALYTYDPETWTHEKLNVPGFPNHFFIPICHAGNLISVKDAITFVDEL